MQGFLQFRRCAHSDCFALWQLHFQYGGESSRNRQTLTEHSVKFRPFPFLFTIGKFTLKIEGYQLLLERKNCGKSRSIFDVTSLRLLESFRKVIKRSKWQYFTIKNCDKTFLKIISSLKKLLKNDDVSTLAERHYQVKISSDFWSINTKKKKTTKTD